MVGSLVSPEVLDLATLPSVAFEERRMLPAHQAVYFVLAPHRKMLYIGATQNLSQRWANHELWPLLRDRSASIIAWLEVKDHLLLRGTERAMIRHFRPPFNTRRYDNSDDSTIMVVRLSRSEREALRVMAARMGTQDHLLLQGAVGETLRVWWDHFVTTSAPTRSKR